MPEEYDTTLMVSVPSDSRIACPDCLPLSVACNLRSLMKFRSYHLCLSAYCYLPVLPDPHLFQNIALPLPPSPHYRSDYGTSVQLLLYRTHFAGKMIWYPSSTQYARQKTIHTTAYILHKTPHHDLPAQLFCLVPPDVAASAPSHILLHDPCLFPVRPIIKCHNLQASVLQFLISASAHLTGQMDAALILTVNPIPGSHPARPDFPCCKIALPDLH